MVKKCFLPVLPSEKVIEKWNYSSDYLPGVHDRVLEYLANLVKQERAKGKRLVFNLVFDEVHLKARSYYNKQTHKFEGCVEFGDDLPKDTHKMENQHDPLAKKALVFMLVCVNGSFKVPVAYYLCDTLNSQEKCSLVLNLLRKLHEYDIDIVSLTCDGDASNVSTCELLGGNLDYFKDKQNFKPYFENPYTKKIIYIFFDACHMIKLIRNYFCSRKILFDSTGKTIKWEFILNLLFKHEYEGLHCACKIRRRHVFFSREKMKVFLATQLLSSSTAKALEFLDGEMHDYKFANSQATAEFCQKMNDIFDILNTKNKFCKRKGKQPITRKNLDAVEIKINDFINYIERLEIDVDVNRKRKKKGCDAPHVPIWIRKNVLDNEHTKTGFLGLIIDLTNYLNLSKFLLEEGTADYILSYKLSQDHLEMFFALIRRMGGFNNNPTTVQFKAAYKKLLMNKTCVIVSSSANCTPQDDTLLLTDGTDLSEFENVTYGISKKYAFNKKKTDKRNSDRKLKNKRENVPKIMTSNFQNLLSNDYKEYSCFEHDYFSKVGDRWVPSEYNTEMIKYISGHVSFVLQKKIHCNSCLDLLNRSNACEKAKLTKIKDNGGLSYASADVEYICMTVERVIRKYKDSLRQTNIFNKLMSETLQVLPKDILDDDVHVFDFEPLYDHRHCLILLVCQTYIDCRMRHESENMNDVLERLRMYSNKTTIFVESNATKSKYLPSTSSTK